MSFLLRGVLIGLIFGVSVGAVGAMTVQRTYAGGIRAGLMTGLGASVADCLYAAVGAFGLTLISDFLLQWQRILRLGGGILLLVMGCFMLLRKPKPEAEAHSSSTVIGVRMFLTSFVVGITNPAAILTFLLAFSSLGLSRLTGAEGFMVVAGVFIGTFAWWLALSFAVSLLKQKTGERILPMLNRLCGIALILFGGIVIFGKG